MKKLLCILLALALLLPLASCSEKTDNADPASDQSGAAANSPADAAAEEEEDPIAKLYEDLPTEDLGGFTFSFLNNISNFAYTLMTAEELTGEGINDAIFNRNQKVEEVLNIQIDEHLENYGDVTSQMNAAIAAADDTFSCFWNEAGFVAPFATSGKLLNVNEISTLNLAKPWWEGKAMGEIQILDKLFFLVGDVHLMFKESFWMNGYNRSIIDRNQLENPYDLVKEGRWTLDVLKTDMETAAQDLNGDGTMDGNDLFGRMRSKGFIFMSALLCADLIANRADYTALVERRQKLKEDEDLQKMLSNGAHGGVR